MKLTEKDLSLVRQILKKNGDLDEFTSKHIEFTSDNRIIVMTMLLNSLTLRDLIHAGYIFIVDSPDLDEYHLVLKIHNRDE